MSPEELNIMALSGDRFAARACLSEVLRIEGNGQTRTITASDKMLTIEPKLEIWILIKFRFLIRDHILYLCPFHKNHLLAYENSLLSYVWLFIIDTFA